MLVAESFSILKYLSKKYALSAKQARAGIR